MEDLLPSERINTSKRNGRLRPDIDAYDYDNKQMASEIEALRSEVAKDKEDLETVKKNYYSKDEVRKMIIGFIVSFGLGIATFIYQIGVYKTNEDFFKEKLIKLEALFEKSLDTQDAQAKAVDQKMEGTNTRVTILETQQKQK